MDEFVRKPKSPNIEPEVNKEVESSINLSENNQPVSSAEPKITNNKRRFSIKNFKVPTPKNKKQWIITIILIIVLLAGTVFAIYWFIFRDNKPPVVQQQPPAPVEKGPEPIISVTSGREVEAAVNERPIYAVQIENSPEARPQSGLRDADIVSEAIAEGGITRFNAIYHDNIPQSLGPVRSLRPYYIDWFMPYDAAIVHAGGSGEALADIRNLGLKDIDHGNSDGILQRISGRYAPHNLYTTGAKVNDLMTKKGYKSNVKTSLGRKKAEPNATPQAKNIAVNISRNLYNVNFTYDVTSNTYLRSQAGMAHIDADTKQQIAPNVVIVPVIPYRIHPDGVHSQYTTSGSGKVYVFQDGNVTEGTWSKADRAAQWELKDNEGKTIKLNPGQTWFSVVGTADKVSYGP